VLTVLLGLAGLAIVYAIGSALARGHVEEDEEALPR
jgi:hypothetical protein